MMPVESALQFIGYDVNQFQFKRTGVSIENNEFQITPQFKKNITEVGVNVYDVSLELLITGSEEQPLPFELYVNMTGHFNLICEESMPDPLRYQLVNKNTIAILFPFLRSTVASITLASNISPVVLPIINLSDAFDDKDTNSD